MVMSCSALGCKNRFTKKSKQVNGQLTFHKFPSDNPMFPEKVALRQLWHTACKRPNWIAPKRAVLCSEHFLPSDFYRFGSVVKLRENVVPSIFKTVPSPNTPLQKKTKAPKKSTKKSIVIMETQPIEMTSSLDLSTCSGNSGNLMNQPYALSQALRNNNFSMMTNTNSICTVKTEFMTVDESIIRSLASSDLSNQNYQFYTTSPTCSTIHTFDATRDDELECLPTTMILKADSPEPKDSVEELRKTKLKLEEARKKIKTLSEKVRRQEARLKNFDHHVNELKYEAQDAAEILAKNLPVGTQQLLRRLAIKTDITTNEEAAYHDDLKSYAMTLYGISPRAYEFVRESFNKALPSTSRIRQWKHEGTVNPLPMETIQITPLVNVPAPTVLHPQNSGLYVVEQRAAVESLLEEL